MVRAGRLEPSATGSGRRRLCHGGGRRGVRASLVLAAAGRRRRCRGWHSGVPPHHRILRGLAADRRCRAGDGAGRPCRPRRICGHDRGGEVGRARAGTAVRAALRPCARRVQPGPRLPGDVRGGGGARAAPRPDADGQPALAAGLGRAVRIRVQPAVARLGRGDDTRDGLGSAAFRGWRGGTGPRRAAPVVHRQRGPATGRPGSSRVPRRLLPCRNLCLPDRAVPRWAVAMAGAVGVEFSDPDADRGARTARLCGRGDRIDPGIRPFRRVPATLAHPADAAGCLRAAGADGPGARSVDRPAVQRAEHRGGQPERAGTALATV